MTFTVDCEVSSAQLNLGEICADDVIDAISVNGMMITSGNYSYGGATYGPCGTGVTIPLTGSIFPGLNELVVRVKNEPFYGIGTVTGLKIKGNLSIIAAGADPSFYMINNGANVQAIPASIPGTHTWAVYASSTGNPGTYSYVGTYNTTYLNFQAQYACYLIRHTVSGESCTACRSQSICNLPCTNICNLSVPQNLQSTSTSPSSLLLSWDPVANASSYVLEIAWNDPACCNNSSQLSFIQTIPVTSNSYSITSQTSTCFSWKVKALCGEESTVSEKKCAHFSGGIRFRTGSTQPDNKIPTLEIFPNPTKDVVSFIVETGRDMEFSISITDIGGRTIMSFDPVTTEGRRGIVEWNTSSLSKGIYIVKVTTGDNLVLTKKLVID
jgi:hypothetical protein